MVSGLEAGSWDRRYVGWFACFNRGEYYEAHDVLEDLWLQEGKGGLNHGFYKGLIQLAGAFVHLQKGRMGPAVALFRLAEANFARYPALHAGIDLGGVAAMSAGWRQRVEAGGGANPLVPGGAVPVVRPPEGTLPA